MNRQMLPFKTGRTAAQEFFRTLPGHAMGLLGPMNDYTAAGMRSISSEPGSASDACP